MPALAVLDTHKLLAALPPGKAVTPKALVASLGVSRATLLRYMTILLEEGVVEESGNGPSRAYRRRTQPELGAKPAAGEPKVFVEMEPATAGVVQRALEVYSRIGIGQFGQIAEMAREGIFRNLDGSEVSLDQIDGAERELGLLKFLLLGMRSGASHGIRSQNVHQDVKTAWAVSKALRHRMVWDHNPQGGIGVHFDEPGAADKVSGLEVHSGPAQPHVVDISGLPDDWVLQFKDGEYRVLGPSPDGQAFQLYAQSASWQTALQKARNSAAGKPAVSRDF